MACCRIQSLFKVGAAIKAVQRGPKGAHCTDASTGAGLAHALRYRPESRIHPRRAWREILRYPRAHPADRAAIAPDTQKSQSTETGLTKRSESCFGRILELTRHHWLPGFIGRSPQPTATFGAPHPPTNLRRWPAVRRLTACIRKAFSKPVEFDNRLSESQRIFGGSCRNCENLIPATTKSLWIVLA